ncbi:hypothetical protein B0H63DRAFT_486966 [Podospora didyma]|uniref:Uncharacterized protein n=1 Tax=Podospora didyma TaxID=330526 RepID=A0AAE0K6C1_9PEZI|nr:hypothetical protein B0H63DRAFT_486966 [Podospora didyma]
MIMADHEEQREQKPSPPPVDAGEKLSPFAEDIVGELVDFPAYPPPLQPPHGFLQNDPANPFQRDNIIERHGHVDIRCEHRDIVHGYLSEETTEPCTLIVLAFRFDPNGASRRIKEASIVVTFAGMDKGKGPEPEVVSMQPDGSFSVEPTTQKETNVHGGGVNVGGSGGSVVPGVEVGGSLKQEHTVSRETTDATRVRGSIDLRDRQWGGKNSVSWTLWENATAETGVVSKLQAAILLKRADATAHFRATVTIKVVADTWTQIGSVFRTTPRDDDVLYNPERIPPSTDRLRKYDTANLGKIDLSSLQEVTFRTILGNAVKEQQG